jgi:hypothetical protein
MDIGKRNLANALYRRDQAWKLQGPTSANRWLPVRQKNENQFHLGDGVNIAAWLEGIAEPGAVCLSEDAYRLVKARLNLSVTDHGARQLKNIADPIRVYSLRIGPPGQTKRAAPLERAAPEMPSALQSSGDKLSIALLPFANMSGDAGQEYFADGDLGGSDENVSALRSIAIKLYLRRTCLR